MKKKIELHNCEDFTYLRCSICCSSVGKPNNKTKAEERLILAALRFKKQIWNNGDGVCRAAIAVLKEREKK